MTYLLDTDTFSNLVRNHASVELRYMLVGKAATCISTVTVNEIEFPRHLHPERVVRHNFRSNTREFCRVGGLQLEDWRESTLEVREPQSAAHGYRSAARAIISHPTQPTVF